MLIGPHVSIAKGLLGAAQEAVSYGATTFMVYTGAPQNSRRTSTDKMMIDEGKAYMAANGITRFAVHAPYIINMATPKTENQQFARDFLRGELMRTSAMGAETLVVHPGAYTESNLNDGISRITNVLNHVLTDDTDVSICLELMAGKGTEIGGSFDDIARIIGGVAKKDRVSVCFDTCHTHDYGYDIVNGLDAVMEQFDKTIGLDKLSVFHLNGSLNERGARKDRHANIGAGADNPKGADKIGLAAIRTIARSKYAAGLPLILETPLIDGKVPYKEEIEAIRNG
jgi:deoxyribonuclease-4